ncbi:MAG: DNA-processing protein DprA, partial [Chlamydiia bacterium]|nr:DNA-processing protein DprA [Chlamydiia bacterium]
WEEQDFWKRDFALIEQTGAKVLSCVDPAYPDRLSALPDGPVVLYYFGQLDCLKQDAVAIIGTRDPSHYGAEQAQRMAGGCARAGYVVVSGLARGVDTAAHRGALSEGRTIAVIGSGLTQIYPKDNAPLARQIVASGLVMSEFPMATPPDRQNFPQRNRIVSGLSQAVILIEAPSKSGAMLTMERAAKQGRARYCLPGRVDMDSFEGNHALIKSGEAHLVCGPEDVCARLGKEPAAAKRKSQHFQPSLFLSDEEEHILNLLGGEELGADQIAGRTRLPIAKLNVLLMGLVLNQMIKEYPGKLYKKVVV